MLCFGGKETLEFLRIWERLAKNYRLGTANNIDSVVDYHIPDMKNSVNALLSMAMREVRDEKQETREDTEWRVFKERALKQYRNADSMQIRLKVDYLKALAANRYIWKDKREVEYYINEFDDVAGKLGKMR